MKFTQKQLERLHELFDIFKKRGFHIEREDYIEMIQDGEIESGDGLDSFELVRRGDGWTMYAEEYFDEKEYKQICKICEEFQIDPPHYVHGE